MKGTITQRRKHVLVPGCNKLIVRLDQWAGFSKRLLVVVKGLNVKVVSILARFLRSIASAARAYVGDGAGKLRSKSKRPLGRRLIAPQAPQVQGRTAPDGGESVGSKPFPADLNLPQLEVAKDPKLMQEIFQKHLQPLAGKAYRILECRVSHVRRRQGRRYILQYTLRLEETNTRRERSQWVTGVIDAKKGRTRRLWEQLRRSDLGGGATADAAASPAFAPFSYIPDLEMLVQVFPYDRQLPVLPLLLAGPPPELEPLLLDRFGPGNWQLETWEVEPVRYLAEARATLRLSARAQDVAGSRTEERRFYAKIYRKEEQGERTYQVLQALWKKAEAGGTGFSVGRPVAYLSDLRTLVQEEAPGTSLAYILRREDSTPAVRKAARALAALHLGSVATLRRRTLQDEVAELEGRRELLRRASPYLESEIEEIVGAVVAGLEEVPPAPTHCDLSLYHILLDDDHLALVDLDAFAQADPLLDVALVLSQLAEMPLHSLLPRDRARVAARAFAEEYFAHVPETWRARLPLRYAGALLKRAAGLYKSQVPGWSDKIEALVKEAKNSLEGRVW